MVAHFIGFNMRTVQTGPVWRAFSVPNPRTPLQFGQGAIRQHSATSTQSFEHEHSLSSVATALWCTPLKVGLASEARFTTGPRAKEEARTPNAKRLTHGLRYLPWISWIPWFAVRKAEPKKRACKIG